MKNRILVAIAVCLLLVLALAACGDAVETGTETESETETERLTDTESQTETETDTETETETETKSETETETEVETEPEPPAVVEEEGGAVLKLYNKENGARAILYKAPDDSFLGDAYFAELSVDGETWYPLDVWTARVALQTTHDVYDLYTTYFVNFDFEGEVLLRVTPADRGDVKVRPIGKTTVAEQTEKATTLHIEKPCQFSFEVGGNIYENLQIFANPVEEIDRTDPDVIYLEAGLYTAENCEWIKNVKETVDGVVVYKPKLFVPSGKTLYISGGAVVQAQIVFSGCNDSSAMGRGVIDLLPWNRANNIRASEAKASPIGFRVENSENVLIEGVIVRDSVGYSIHGGSSEGITVDNFKAIAATQWSDGIDTMACSDVIIRNSFLRTNDDCIAIYGSRWAHKGDSRNYEIYNCVFWADNAHAINIGNHGSGDPSDPDIIENIYFHDIDVLEVHSINTTGAFRVACGGENIVRNITLERINMEGTRSALLRLHFVNDANSGGTWGGTISNTTFRDIFFDPREGQTVKAYLQGHDENRSVRNVYFDNVWVGDEKIDADSPLLEQNSYVYDVTFE